MKSKNLSEKILRSVRSQGFKYVKLDSVIETSHIVQRSGENFRKLIFSFNDNSGKELCLRPDLTIASCLRYLENNQELLKTSSNTAHYLKRQVTQLVNDHRCLLDLRMHGLLGCFVVNTETDPSLPLPAKNMTLLIQQQLMHAGIFAFSRESFIFIAPPLIITKEEVDSVLETISSELSKVDTLYYQHLNQQ